MKRPKTVQGFLEVLVPIVLKLCPKSLFPSVVLAQAALESGWNLKSKTLFGIKGKGSAGSVNVATKEQRPDGTVDKIRDDFARYANLEESVKGYLELIMGQGQYDKAQRYAGARNCQSPQQMIEAIYHAGYATDLGYVKDVLSVIRTLGLEEYDDGYGV